MTTLQSAPSTRTRAIPRFEDGAFLRGEARYVGDLRIDGLLHLAVVRSPYPFGRLLGVDLAPVRALPGVVDAFGAADVPGYLAPIPTRLPVPGELERFLQPPLAGEEVRYVGQPVAVVVAVSPEAALDAADAVLVEVDDAGLPAEEVMHTEESLFGELAEAFAAAAVVVRDRFTVGRQAGLPVETRGLLADYDADRGELSLWAAAKAPHFLHAAVARALSLAPERVRLHPIDTGGGFGVRGEMHPEDLLVPLAALRAGRPVRWLEGRLEHLQSAYQSRGQTWDAAIAVSAKGEILGLDATFRGDLGAFIGPNGLTPGRLAIRSFAGPYRVPAFRCGAAYVRSCKPPLGTMRGPGYFESAFVRERLLDLAAGELGLARSEIRRRNLVTAAEMPYATGLDGVVYDGGEYAVTLDRALGEIRGGPVAAGSLEGIGVACVVEGSGTPGIETARAHLDREGRVTVTVGSSSFGQGHATSFAQIVAGVLSIEPELVEIVEGSGEQTGGTFASRSAVTAGSACHRAAAALREALAAGRAAPLDVHVELESTAAAYTYGACAARVEVDPETGSVRLLELTVAVDAGVVINPDIVRGQLAGGAVQGAGGALFEQLDYSADCEPLTGGLRDYHVPLAADMPEVRTVVLELVPSPRNPLGVRGVGEISTAGAAAAVANAVAAALGPGARVTDLPLAPWRLVGETRLGSMRGSG